MKNSVVRLPIPLLPFLSLREKCPNTEFFLVRIFRIQSKCGKIRISKNSLSGHFSRSVWASNGQTEDYSY